MTADRKQALRDLAAFAAIAALAFALRLAHLLQARDCPLFDALFMDGESYGTWSDRIVAGDWIGKEVFYQAPLYPYFLALVKLALGGDLWTIRLVQIALGSLACGALFLAGRAFFSRGAGIAAGILLALYPPAIFFDGLIQKASLGLLWTVALLWLIGRASRGPSPARFALAGASLALLVLTREETILLVPVVAVWILLHFRAQPKRSRASWTAGYAAGLALVLLPVGFRNLAVGDEFALTTSQAGSNFYIGNNPAADGTYVPLRPGRQNTVQERRDAFELAERAEGRKLTPGEVSRHWFGRSFAWIRAEPMAWARLLGRKVALLFNAYEMPDYEDLYFYERYCPLLRGLGSVWHYGVLVPLAAAGAMLTWARRRELSILYALLGTMAAAVVLFYVFARYRYPVVPILALFAGAALVETRAAVRERRILGPLAAFVAAAVAANWPIHSKDWQLPEAFNNAGSVLARKGDDAGAVEMFRRALELEPGSPETIGNLGVSLMRLGRVGEGIEAFRESARLRPDDARAHLRLAAALEQVGRVAEAADPLGRALALDAQVVLDAALVMCRQTADRDPVALDILASAYAEMGLFDDAVAASTLALARPSSPERFALIEEIRLRLELYRRKLKWRAGG